MSLSMRGATTGLEHKLKARVALYEFVGTNSSAKSRFSFLALGHACPCREYLHHQIFRPYAVAVMKIGGRALSVKKCHLLVKGICAAQEMLKPKYFRGISTSNPKSILSVVAARELRIASAAIIRFLGIGNAGVLVQFLL